MPKLLDLFCGAGGASMGYAQAGFDVTGVDMLNQSHYPFDFIRGDANRYLANYGDKYDIIVASPPCQAHSKLRHISGFEYDDYIQDTRSLMIDSDAPYVIENVIGAPLLKPIVLCGTMFGLPCYRHRIFESNISLTVPEHKYHTERTTSGHGKTRVGARYSHFESACDYSSPAKSFCKALGVEWMTGLEAAQAVPPAYTEYIGRQLMKDYYR